MSLEQIVTEERELAYPDHCKKSFDGAEDSLDWYDSRDLLREIQGFDS